MLCTLSLTYVVYKGIKCGRNVFILFFFLTLRSKLFLHQLVHHWKCLKPDAFQLSPLRFSGTLLSRLLQKSSGSQGSLLVECWTLDRKITSSNPSRSGRRIFFSRVNFLCWLLLLVCSTSCYPTGIEKTPVSLPKVQLAGYTLLCLRPWPSKATVGWLCCPGMVWGTYQGNELTCNSS